MSSYLLYFGSGNLDRKTVDANGVQIGVVSRKGVVDQAIIRWAPQPSC